MSIRSEQLTRRKRRIESRLEKSSAEDRGRPMLSPAGIKYELSERSQGMCYGGIGAMLQFVHQLGLVRRHAEPPTGRTNSIMTDQNTNHKPAARRRIAGLRTRHIGIKHIRVRLFKG